MSYPTNQYSLATKLEEIKDRIIQAFRGRIVVSETEDGYVYKKVEKEEAEKEVRSLLEEWESQNKELVENSEIIKVLCVKYASMSGVTEEAVQKEIQEEASRRKNKQ